MSPPHDSGQGHSEPWVPEEPSPSGADTPAPHLVPMVVSEWERSQTEDGAVETLPQRLAIPRAAVTIKADEQRSRERVRRFVEAWRWLSRRRRRHTTSPGFSVYESDRH
ncbi:MAG: hypothetical protein ACRDI2_26025, partial [Chloroflexota bacterium]